MTDGTSSKDLKFTRKHHDNRPARRSAGLPNRRSVGWPVRPSFCRFIGLVGLLVCQSVGLLVCENYQSVYSPNCPSVHIVVSVICPSVSSRSVSLSVGRIIGSSVCRPHALQSGRKKNRSSENFIAKEAPPREKKWRPEG